MADLYQRRKSQESLSQFSAYHQHRSNIINAASEMEAESTRTEPEKPDDMWQQTDLADLQFLDGLSASAWADSVELIERYESKTQRSLFRLLKELRALQAARRSSEATTQPSPVLPQAPSASGPGSPDTGREVPLSSSETDLQKVADETCRAAAGLALTSPADAHSCTL
jgi:hypothetical protein